MIEAKTLEEWSDRVCHRCGSHVVRVDVERHPELIDRRQIIWTAGCGCVGEDGERLRWTDFLNEELDLAYHQRDRLRILAQRALDGFEIRGLVGPVLEALRQIAGDV